MDLVTLAEYKQYVGISSTTQDNIIKAIIPKVSDLTKSYCRRTFVDYVSDAKVEVFNGGKELVPAEFPILEVSGLESSEDYGLTYSTLTPFVDYILDLRNQVILPPPSLSIFPYIPNGYRLTYTAGYETLPGDLKLAVLDLVTYYLKNDMAVKSQRDAGSNTVQIEYITRNTLPSHIARVLDMYLSDIS